MTVGDLLGVVRGRVCGNSGFIDGDWVLQRLGEPPLDPDGTPATLDLPAERGDAERAIEMLFASMERIGQMHPFAKGMGLAAPQISIGRAAVAFQPPGRDAAPMSPVIRVSPIIRAKAVAAVALRVAQRLLLSPSSADAEEAGGDLSGQGDQGVGGLVNSSFASHPIGQLPLV